MRLLLNIIWFIFGGLWLALGYLFAGILMCLLIVTIPFGLAAFRMASYALWPFGRAVVPLPEAGTGSALMNLLWFVLAGWWLALGHIVTAIAQAITIIGIPLAIGNLKMLPVSLMPFGKQIVPRSALPPGREPLHSL
ncbi:YccF domain-containing protein [Dermacoccaceae bacterium W4C1]